MKLTTLLLLTVVTIGKASAQKLPKVQQSNLRMPAGAKIDGKTDEWNDQFQAYNPATNLSYTIANNDKKLYFIFLRSNVKSAQSSTNGGVVVSERALANYIVNGGIRINIQKNATKTDEGAAGIKFPYLRKSERISFIIRGAGTVNSESDSVMRSHNKRLTTGLKWIYTEGIAGVDNILPVYNENGIEAAAAFDLKKNFVCELAVDLKRLGLSVNDVSGFTYHIMVNADPDRYQPMQELYETAPRIGKNADGSPMTAAQAEEILKRLTSGVDPNSATTDFWGEYTLAK